MPKVLAKSPFSALEGKIGLGGDGANFVPNTIGMAPLFPPERWTEVLLDASLTAAALDRLTHRCHIVETGSESYRLKEAKRGRVAPDGLNRDRKVSSTSPVNESRVAELSALWTTRAQTGNICLLGDTLFNRRSQAMPR
ncbi:IstB-like ATP binding protein [Singulisphaera sp. GP187]|nr:IstB-like ATP binding protein [Singulisphaera sp. GP187]